MKAAGERAARAAGPDGGCDGSRRPGRLRADQAVRQETLTALQAAATVAYSWLVAPYRSLAAFRVAVRAPL
ncbi:hypothetical protein GCM10010260_70720 [Streptomyces filipinensis]|uniref:Uncharacterized protein n=1 Tax=Streptomyces filipinensis TaxID=66887 RepID=A0A918MFE5_9ACTN|nr:hypothetical protein GCM10010260_70720 [Streptomyces filipinensis]